MLPTEAVDHLLVREHGLALRAPVHAAALPIRQPALEHAQEEPLVPPVIFRLARRDLAPPVVAEAESLADRLHLRDVRVGPFARRDAALDRGVFGRQAERVPSDRMQHVETAHPLVTRHRIADRVVPHVAHVQRARRIREHFEQVVFRARRVVIDGAKRLLLLPHLLPLCLDTLRIVIAHSAVSLGLRNCCLRHLV